MNTSVQNPDELFDEQIKIWEEKITLIQSIAIKRTNLSIFIGIPLGILLVTFLLTILAMRPDNPISQDSVLGWALCFYPLVVAIPILLNNYWGKRFKMQAVQKLANEIRQTCQSKNISKTKVIDSLLTRLPSSNICDAVITKVDSEKTAMIKEEKEKEKATAKIAMMNAKGESTPLHLSSEADDTNENNLCEKCKSRSGVPAYFHYGTQNSTEKASLFKKTTTTKSQSIGISSAIVCTECVARFRWTSLTKLFSQFLLIAVVLGVCMFIPVLNALAGVLLIFLPILFLILFVIKLFSSLRTLAEELAVNLREKEFENKGFNKLWTSDEYRSTFRQISPVSNLWNPPTPFNPGNSLKRAASVTLLSFTLFCLSITTYVFLIVITPIGTPDPTVWIDENYRWYNIFSTLGCLTAPLPLLGGIIWFIGTYRSTKT